MLMNTAEEMRKNDILKNAAEAYAHSMWGILDCEVDVMLAWVRSRQSQHAEWRDKPIAYGTRDSLFGKFKSSGIAIAQFDMLYYGKHSPED